MRSFFPGRQLDDYGHAVLRFPHGALGTITVSQVTHGRLNDLTLEIDGTSGSLGWRQEDPERLVVRRHGQPVCTFERNPRAPDAGGGAGLCRLPGGHPEGFFEAFANIYCEAFDDMLAHAAGVPRDERTPQYPSVRDGVEGVCFVEQCLASQQDNGTWKSLRRERAQAGK